MSVTGKPLPPAPTLLGAVDQTARETMNVLRDEVRPVVTRETPHRSGVTAAKLAPRIGKTSTGYSLTVGASRGAKHGHVTVAEVVRWVTRGTGVHREGPGPKHRITAKNPLRRMTLPGGAKRWSVAGQQPNPFVDRILVSGTPKVLAAAEQGAQNVGPAVQQAVDRS